VSARYDAGAAEGLPPGTHRIVEAGGREYGVFNVGGSYYALPNVCFHQNGPLCRGRVSGTYVADATTGFEWRWAHDGELVICPWHGLEYHIPTGRCLAYPGRGLAVRPVEVVGGRLEIVLG
jgi:nitrite reductase (NADH) small subunit